MKDFDNNSNNDRDQLNALVDNELDDKQREILLARLDSEPELRGELCDIHRVKDLLRFSYPLKAEKKKQLDAKKMNFGAIAASFLAVLSIGFLAGYLTFNQRQQSNNIAQNPVVEKLNAVAIPNAEYAQDKVIIYLGKSQKEKFDETLDKAEALLTKYKNQGTEVYVVTSAGGIDLLRTSNTAAKNRIKTMSGLYKSLHFVACNNQIYQLHQKGQSVNLVDEAEVAPSAVQFVVDHLKKGWKYIAI